MDNNCPCTSPCWEYCEHWPGTENMGHYDDILEKKEDATINKYRRVNLDQPKQQVTQGPADVQWLDNKLLPGRIVMPGPNPQQAPKAQPWIAGDNKDFREKELAKLNVADDPVHQPAHYARWAMQPIEFIAINNLPFWLANVIKYAMRYDAKNGLQDLYKARAYLDMQIRKLEGEPKFWEKPVAEQQACEYQKSPGGVFRA